MKTRKQIVADMCLTMRHDFGLERTEPAYPGLSSGLTVAERQALWNQMAQVFDDVIFPYMEFRGAKFVPGPEQDWTEP
jgi:hypothetical protein